MRLNLAVRPTFRQAPLVGWLAAGVVLVAAGLWISHTNANLASAVRTLQIERARLTELQAQAREAERVAAPRRRAQAIAAALNHDAIDPFVLRRIEAVTPADLWITTADLSRDRLSVAGSATTWQSAAEFAARLPTVPGLRAIELKSVQARGQHDGYDFAITAELTHAPPEPAP